MSPRAGRGGGGVSGPAYPSNGTAAGGKGKGKGKVPDLVHCFELHSGKLLGDKKNREGRLYFKVCFGILVSGLFNFGAGLS